MSDAPPAEFAAARNAGAARRRSARATPCRAWRRCASRSRTCCAAAHWRRRAVALGLHGVRVRPAVPRGDRQAGRRDHPAAARAAPAGAADRRRCSPLRSTPETSVAWRSAR